MLEPRAIRLRCRTGEDLQARVELQRVGRDGDGILALGAQQLGQLHRDLGLAHPRGPEQRDERQGRHPGQDRRAHGRDG